MEAINWDNRNSNAEPAHRALQLAEKGLRVPGYGLVRNAYVEQLLSPPDLLSSYANDLTARIEPQIHVRGRSIQLAESGCLSFDCIQELGRAVSLLCREDLRSHVPFASWTKLPMVELAVTVG
jgi:hypothetical protein